MKRTCKKLLAAVLAAALVLCMTLGLTGCDDTGMVEDPLTTVYRSFVQQNFFKDYIAVRADVTHDGTDELIVVDYSHTDDELCRVTGYIYAYRDGRVQFLTKKVDGAAHAFGQYFSLGLVPIGNGMYDCISEAGTLYQGYGEIELGQYHIDPKTGYATGIRTLHKFENHTDHPKDAEFDQYVAACNRSLQNVYLVYVYQWDYTGGRQLPRSMIVAQG